MPADSALRKTHPQPSAREIHAKYPSLLCIPGGPGLGPSPGRPLGTSPAARAPKSKPSGLQSQVLGGHQTPQGGPPLLPLEGGQAWGRRAGRATPVPGKHTPAGSGAIGPGPLPGDPDQQTGHSCAPHRQGPDRPSSRELGACASGAPPVKQRLSPTCGEAKEKALQSPCPAPTLPSPPSGAQGPFLLSDSFPRPQPPQPLQGPDRAWSPAPYRGQGQAGHATPKPLSLHAGGGGDRHPCPCGLW